MDESICCCCHAVGTEAETISSLEPKYVDDLSGLLVPVYVEPDYVEPYVEPQYVEPYVEPEYVEPYVEPVAVEPIPVEAIFAEQRPAEVIAEPIVIEAVVLEPAVNPVVFEPVFTDATEAASVIKPLIAPVGDELPASGILIGGFDLAPSIVVEPAPTSAPVASLPTSGTTIVGGFDPFGEVTLAPPAASVDGSVLRTQPYDLPDLHAPSIGDFAASIGTAGPMSATTRAATDPLTNALIREATE